MKRKTKIYNWLNGSSPSINKQALWDAVANHAEVDYGHGPSVTGGGNGGMFFDTAVTTPATNDGEVKSLKAFGQNKPSPANLVYKGTTALTPTNALLWWKDLRNTMYPTYFDFGNFNKGLRMINGALNTTYFESDPGSFTAKVRPIDLIYVFVYLPDIADEGFNGIKSIAHDHVSFIDGYSPDINLTGGNPAVYNYKPYERNIVRLNIDGAGNFKVWINTVPDATDSNPTFSGSGIVWTTTEWWWGTNSHVLTSYLHTFFTKFGTFSSAAIASIYSNLLQIWPLGKPAYPLITEMYYADASTWDGTGKAWRQGRGKSTVFSGGNGVAGTHRYMWYYFDSGDATLFPSGDGVLTNHRQVPGSVSIATMAGGNSLDQVSVDGFNLMSAPVAFSVNVATTADLIVTNINAAQTKYFAQHRASSGVILLHPIGLGCNNYSAGVVTPSATGFTPTKIDYPRAQDLVRTTFAGAGQIFSGVAGAGTIRIKGITFPFDSVATPGEPIPSGWILDNII